MRSEEYGYGALIERGIVVEVSSGTYTVRSLSRDGIVTPLIPALYDADEYSTGDVVYFFLFNDGHGMILAGA